MVILDDKYQGSEKTDMVAPDSPKGAVMTDFEHGESREVFQTGVEGVNFRTVSWQRATIVFCKMNFAMSILSTPQALGSLGAVGGTLALLGFIIVNLCKLKTNPKSIPPGNLLSFQNSKKLLQIPRSSSVTSATDIQNATVSFRLLYPSPWAISFSRKA